MKISTGEIIVFQNELTDVFKSYVEEIGQFQSDEDYFYFKSIVLEYV
mgnify:FL=1